MPLTCGVPSHVRPSVVGSRDGVSVGTGAARLFDISGDKWPELTTMTMRDRLLDVLSWCSHR